MENIQVDTTINEVLVSRALKASLSSGPLEITIVGSTSTTSTPVDSRNGKTSPRSYMDRT